MDPCCDAEVRHGAGVASPAWARGRHALIAELAGSAQADDELVRRSSCRTVQVMGSAVPACTSESGAEMFAV